MAAPRPVFLDHISFALLALFVVELVLGGPGFWRIGEVSLRKLLFLASVGWLGGLWLLGWLRLGAGQLLLLLGLLLYLVYWGALRPASGRAPIADAWQESAPLLTALLAVFATAYFRDRPRAWARLQAVALASLALVALANIALWLLGSSGDAGVWLARAASLYWFTLGRLDLEPPLYIGLMPDGFFRAMWITAVLYVPALLYCLAQRRTAGVVLFATALFCTYTRSLWLSALLALLLGQLLSQARSFLAVRTALMALFLLVTAGLLVLSQSVVNGEGDIGGAVWSRVTSSLSDSGAQERLEQVEPLIEAWQDAPVLGQGFGASASLIRSDEAPYSYELTALALLMKTGVVGLLLLGLLLGGLWLRALFRNTPRSPTDAAGLASVLALLLAAATNPYLLNFVGMSLLCFLFMKLELQPEESVSRPVTRSVAVDGHAA